MQLWHDSAIALLGIYPRVRKPGFPGGPVVKNLLANAGDIRDTGLIPVSGRSPAEGNGNSLLYSCLENPMDREAWQYTVHSVAKNRND